MGNRFNGIPDILEANKAVITTPAIAIHLKLISQRSLSLSLSFTLVFSIERLF